MLLGNPDALVAEEHGESLDRNAEFDSTSSLDLPAIDKIL
jgi:hypothetical protein